MGQASERTQSSLRLCDATNRMFTSHCVLPPLSLISSSSTATPSTIYLHPGPPLFSYRFPSSTDNKSLLETCHKTTSVSSTALWAIALYGVWATEASLARAPLASTFPAREML